MLRRYSCPPAKPISPSHAVPACPAARLPGPQPVIPVFTATMGILLKMEHAHPQKLVGIGMAVIGAISMVSPGGGGRWGCCRGQKRRLTAEECRAAPVPCS